MHEVGYVGGKEKEGRRSTGAGNYKEIRKVTLENVRKGNSDEGVREKPRKKKKCSRIVT